MLAPPPLAISVTGAAVAARLRREGYDWRQTLIKVGAPVLLVHGVYDCVPPSEADALARLIPRAHVLQVPDCGHMPFFEWPAMVFEAALRVLDAECRPAQAAPGCVRSS